MLRVLTSEGGDTAAGENISNIYIVRTQCEKYSPNFTSRYQCIDRAGMLSRIYVQSGRAHPDCIV